MILVLNGPNLDLLGVREPEVYGHTTLARIEAMCRAEAEVDFRQTNDEGEALGWVQEALARAIVVNPAGWSFRSLALRDALAEFDGPVIELHISNIHARDAAHRNSLISGAATAVIAGLGARGYVHAVRAAAEMLDGQPR